MPTWTPSSPALAPQPTLGWTGGALQLSAASVTQAATYTAANPVLGDNVLVRIAKFGTPTADCTIVLEFGIDDAATQFGEAITFTNAQITGGTNGFTARVPSCGKFYRFLLKPGTMTGANGFNISARS